MTLRARCPDAEPEAGSQYREMTMVESDAYSVLARSVVTVRDQASEGRAWDDRTVQLAAGVLQRAFRLDEEARNAFLDLARHAERMQATQRWRGR